MVIVWLSVLTIYRDRYLYLFFHLGPDEIHRELFTAFTATNIATCTWVTGGNRGELKGDGEDREKEERMKERKTK